MFKTLFGKYLVSIKLYIMFVFPTYYSADTVKCIFIYHLFTNLYL